MVQAGMGNTVAAATVRYVEKRIAPLHEELVRLGASAAMAARALGTLTDLVGSPKQELLFRVNAWCKGEDPGTPVHWRGLQ